MIRLRVIEVGAMTNFCRWLRFWDDALFFRRYWRVSWAFAKHLARSRYAP